MTSDPFILTEQVTKADRERAEAALRTEHQQGRLTTEEFNERLGRVYLAETPVALADAQYGPVAAPAASSRPAEPVFTGTVENVRRPFVQQGNGLAVFAHLSPFVLWLFGPLVAWALAKPGSTAKREAAKAFNWQLLALVIGIGVSIVAGLVLGNAGDVVSRVWTGIWAVLTIIGAVMAAKGRDWTNPLRARLGWEVLAERPR